MRLKTSFFSKAIFWKNTKRFWPLWATYFAVWFLSQPMTLISSMRYSGETTALQIGYSWLSNTVQLTVFMTAVFSIASAMAVYSFMYSARSTSMMASLPISREGLFFTSFLSGFVWLVVPEIVVVLISVVAEASFGLLGITYLLQWLAIAVMQTLLFYGLASFCAVLTGHKVVLPILFAVVNYLAIVLESLVKEILATFVYGVTATNTLASKWLSPVYMLWKASFSLTDKTGAVSNFAANLSLSSFTPAYVVYGSWLYMGICAVAGFLLAELALLIFRRRQMENASDVVAVPALRPVFKYVMTFVCAMGLGIVLFSVFYHTGSGYPEVILTACMLVSAAVGYFASEMLIHKSYKVFKKWKGFAVSALIIVLAVIICNSDVFGVEKRVPDPQDVESVTVSVYGDSEMTSVEGIEAVTKLHQSFIDNKKLYEKMGRNSANSSRWSVTIRYELSNGSTLERGYTLYSTEEMKADKGSDIRMLDGIINSPEAILSRYEPQYPPTDHTASYGYVYFGNTVGETKEQELTVQQIVDLYYEGILPDFQNGNLGTIDLFSTSKEAATAYCNIYLEFSENQFDEKSNYSTLSLDVSPQAVNTLSYLKDVLGIDVHFK